MFRWITLPAVAVLAVVCIGEAQVRERTYYNPYTGRTDQAAVAYNPYTGRDTAAVRTTPTTGGNTYARGAAYNPYTGNYHGGTNTVNSAGTKEESRTYYNPATGKTAQVQGAYNPYTGKYAYHASYRR
jgi:hypothetical protein